MWKTNIKENVVKCFEIGLVRKLLLCWRLCRHHLSALLESKQVNKATTMRLFRWCAANFFGTGDKSVPVELADHGAHLFWVERRLLHNDLCRPDAQREVFHRAPALVAHQQVVCQKPHLFEMEESFRHSQKSSTKQNKTSRFRFLVLVTKTIVVLRSR